MYLTSLNANEAGIERREDTQNGVQVKLIWEKIIGYCEGSTYKDYELTTFRREEKYKWFIDKKDGEPIASGYALTAKIAKQIAEVTLKQEIGKRENYEKINYGNYHFDDIHDSGL